MQDKSGVLTVSANFYETESGHGFSIRGDEEGKTAVTVVLTERITEKTLPGEYRYKDVTVYDTSTLNTSFIPEKRFRVENPEGDHEGPKLAGWRVTK